MKVEAGRGGQNATIERPPASRVDQPPSGWLLWWMAIRPRTLTIAVSPVLAGTMLAWSQAHLFTAWVLAATLVGAVLIQAGTNLWNDVADALNGGDQPLRQGPPRVTALGWATPKRVRQAAMICFGLAALVGMVLVWRGGWPILALGTVSLLAGWAYSSGPRPIAASPLGEVFVIAFFGIAAICGTLWLQAGVLAPVGIVLGIAIGLPAAAVLMANNYRDAAADRLAGRRTLAILLGTGGSRTVYAGLMLAPFPILLSTAAPDGGWMALAAAPEAVRLVLAFATEPRGPAFNTILAHTARFQLALTALVCVGMVI